MLDFIKALWRRARRAARRAAAMAAEGLRRARRRIKGAGPALLASGAGALAGAVLAEASPYAAVGMIGGGGGVGLALTPVGAVVGILVALAVLGVHLSARRA